MTEIRKQSEGIISGSRSHPKASPSTFPLPSTGRGIEGEGWERSTACSSCHALTKSPPLTLALSPLRGEGNADRHPAIIRSLSVANPGPRSNPMASLSTFNLQRPKSKTGAKRSALDVQSWALNVECFPSGSGPQGVNISGESLPQGEGEVVPASGRNESCLVHGINARIVQENLSLSEWLNPLPCLEKYPRWIFANSERMANTRLFAFLLPKGEGQDEGEVRAGPVFQRALTQITKLASDFGLRISAFGFL